MKGHVTRVKSISLPSKHDELCRMNQFNLVLVQSLITEGRLWVHWFKKAYRIPRNNQNRFLISQNYLTFVIIVHAPLPNINVNHSYSLC